MRVLLVLVPTLAVTATAAWLLIGGPVALLVSGVVTTSTCGLLALAVASPRSQWIVPSLHRGSGGTPALALTFDDGPDPRYTPRVLQLLAAHGARATFFVVGQRAEQHPELVRAIAAAGHQIGSHSYTHGPRFHFQRSASMAADIRAGVDVLAAILGRVPLAFRPPLGLRVPHLREALRLCGLPLTCVTWTARGADAVRRPPAAILARLLPALRPGAILTLHDGAGLGGSDDREPTLAALADLLPAIATRGLACVRLEELPCQKPWPAWQECRPDAQERTVS